MTSVRLPMHRCALLLFVCVFGCKDPPNVGQRTVHPTSASSTLCPAKAIELQDNIYLARIDTHTTVTADGLLHSVRTDNKSYGATDIDPKLERVEVREGRLTAEQMERLSGLFVNWESLASTPYGGVADGGNITLRYGDETVTGGSDVPKQVLEARNRLNELTRSMPVVKP